MAISCIGCVAGFRRRCGKGKKLDARNVTRPSLGKTSALAHLSLSVPVYFLLVFVIVRLHRLHTIHAAYCYVPSSAVCEVCMYACWIHWRACPEKRTAKPIELPFGGE